MGLTPTNRLLTITTIAMITILAIIYHTKLTKQFGLFYYDGLFRGFWSVLRLLSRFSLFSLCIISYFWELPAEPHIIEEATTISEDKEVQPDTFKTLVLQYTDSALNQFLQIAFTAFWPLRTTSHVVIKCASVLSVYVVPLLHICVAYCRIKGRGPWSFFLGMKFLRKLVQLSLFIYGVYLGKQYFRRPPIYPKDVKFAKMPWRRYRTFDATAGQSNIRKTGQTSKWILFGLLFACILEAFLKEYEHLNRREGAHIIEAERSNYIVIFHKFLTGHFSQVIFPLFVYPVEVFILFCTLLWVSWGRKLIKGLCTYYILISSHVTLVTILSLVLVWEIQRFDHDLRYNLIEVFEKTSNAKTSAKRRLYIFDQIKIKRSELIPHLSVIVHYLVVDRLLFIILDFWNFTCDQRIEFNMPAFMARHLFQLILTGWVVLKMALFNLNWPYQLIDTVHRWRLQSWILSTDQKDMKSKPMITDCKEVEQETDTATMVKTDTPSYYDSARYFLDKEYELWSQYLSQERFVKRFGFRIFGYRVDIRWFTLSFAFQLAFISIGLSKKYFGSATEWMCGQNSH